MDYDGWVTIGTKLDTKEFEKDLKNAEKKLKEFSKEEEKLLKEKGKTEANIERYEKEIAEYEKLTNKAEEYKSKIKELNAEKNNLSSGGRIKETDVTQYQEISEKIREAEQEYTKLNNEIDKQYSKIEKNEASYNKELNKINEINAALTQNAHNQGLVNQEITVAQQKVSQIKSVKEIQKQIDGISKSTNSAIRHVAKWAVAIFSVASIYGMISRASGTLARYNETYAANLEYINYALSQMLAPILEKLVSLAYTLLNYINYIAQAWFGINLFANASARGMAKANSSAQQLKRTLTGFDEMNVVSDTSSSGGAGAGVPSIDLSQMQGEVPVWLKWIADNKELILGAMTGIATALTLCNLGLKNIKALGIGLLISGVVIAIGGLIKYLKDPSFKNFGTIIEGIGIAVIGLGVLFLGLPGIITGVVVLIVGIVIKYWDQIKTFLQKGIDWLTGKSDWVHKMFGDTIGNIYDTFVDNLQLILNWFDRTFTNMKTIFDNIIGFVKNVFTGNWKGAWENIKNIFKAVWDQIKNTFSTIFGLIKNNVVTWASTVGSIMGSVLKTAINGVLKMVESVLNSPIRAINKLIDVINSVPGISLGRISTFSLPRLAVGGIVNLPGRGIPIGGAIAGEAGAEGVIPLTDSQAMETLGQAIGRYITINANITNTMNGRVLSRQLQKIQANRDFAYNT